MIPLENPYPLGAELHADFAVVSDVQHDPSRIDAAKALLGRAGCLEDALTYYQGADPVYEINDVYFNKLNTKEQMSEFFGRSIVGLHAAEILIASIVYPGLYDRRDSRRVRMLSKEANWYMIATDRSHGMSTPFHTIYAALNEITERSLLTTTDAITLSMSAEMLSSALTWWQNAQLNIYKSDKEGFANDDLLRTIFQQSESALVSSVIDVEETVRHKTIDEYLPGIQSREHLDRIALGLKAHWRLGSMLMHPMFRYKDPEMVNEILNSMIGSLQIEFIESDLLDVRKYPKHLIKGLLHELIWLIDAQMVMIANPNDYKTIHVGPTSARLDRPVTGRTEYLRGVDYGIIDADDDGGKIHLINLKSGNHDNKKYHPRIRVVKERNFQDMQSGRLRNKLRFYREVVESGFKMPETRDIIEKYALDSVKEELALHKNPNPSEDWPYY